MMRCRQVKRIIGTAAAGSSQCRGTDRQHGVRADSVTGFIVAQTGVVTVKRQSAGRRAYENDTKPVIGKAQIFHTPLLKYLHR
jgi:hypothetical protein